MSDGSAAVLEIRVVTASLESAALVGSYAPGDAAGIYLVTVNETEGRLRIDATFAGVRNPSHLATHPGGDHLFAVSETSVGGDGVGGTVHAFRITRGRGGVDLAALNERSTDGDHPCHVCVDASGRWLAVSNYGTGNVAVFPIGPDGWLGEMTSSVQHSGSGPNADRQAGPHVHSTVFTPEGRFLIVADLGIDRVVIYAFDPDVGSLSPHDDVATKPGAGPRHMAFHPDGRHLFVVNELDSTITAYRYDARAGALQPWQTVPALPEGAPAGMAADIHVSRSGSRVYASNRGHDSVTVCAFDMTSGLSRTVIRSSGGQWPRGFCLMPSGRHLLAANRHSNEIVLLPLLAGGSDIGEPLARVEIAQPSCVSFLSR